MRFNMLFCIQITHTRTEQSIYNHFKVETAQPQTSIEDIKNLKKYERRLFVSTLQPFVEKWSSPILKGIVLYLCMIFGYKYNT